MKYRKLSYWISGILLAASICAFLFKGLNYGIDFAGGIAMEVTPNTSDYTIDKMRHDLAAFRPELQEVAETKSVLIRIGLEKGATDEMIDQSKRNIKATLGDKVTVRSEQFVGAKMTNELIRDGILAVMFSFVMMSVYIWIRYKGGYAIGSLISLILDFVFMFGFFAIVGLEFNLTAIAVILMGVGYSINDKVVNYDRIEENVKKYHKMPMSDLIDLSVNEMMRRTIMTSVTTLLSMLALYMFAGEMLREFSLSMMFSIIIGTLTSVYVSNVMLIHFNIRDVK